MYLHGLLYDCLTIAVNLQFELAYSFHCLQLWPVNQLGVVSSPVPLVVLDSHSEDIWEDWHIASRTCVGLCTLLHPFQSEAWRVESSRMSTHPNDDLSGDLSLDNVGYCTSAVQREST